MLRQIWMDIKYGIIKQWKRYVVVSLLVCYPLFNLFSYAKGMFGLQAGVWDYFIEVFIGILPIGGNEEKELVLPAFYIAFGCLMSYLVYDYPAKDLNAGGIQILIRTRNMTGYYLSKYLWNIMAIAVAHAMVVLVVTIFGVVSGGEFVLQEELVRSRTGADYVNMKTVMIGGILLPALSAMAIAQVQMLIGILTRPIYGMMTAVGIYLLSIFSATMWLPGNGIMLLRTNLCMKEGIPYRNIVIICVIWIMLCYPAGCVALKKKDMIPCDE